MIHRNARPHDAHFGKFNGIGGKVERDEDIVTSFRREVREEAGIECDELHLAGTISWPGFGRDGGDWFGFLFRVTQFSGTVLKSNPEGELLWVPIPNGMTLPMWAGDRYFLPMIFNFTAPPFHGLMPYQNGHPVSWTFTSLPR